MLRQLESEARMSQQDDATQPLMARTPTELAPPKVEPYRAPSAGRGALWSSLKELKAHTGLLTGAQLLARVNQEGGFDCPGCAWPDPQGHRSAFEFCENGVKAVAAEGTKRRVGPAFFKEHSIQSLSERSDYWLELQGRLTHPMYKPEGASHYEPISWPEAFRLTAERLKGLSDPNRAIFYTSGRTSNEAAFLYQLLARRLGTNNLPDCSNMCHESSGRGLLDTIGTGKGTVQLTDFEQAECILVIGQNPGTNHPRMLTSLEAAARRGCHIISINPLRERGLERFAHPQSPLALLGRSTAISTHYLQVKINGDVALLKGLMKALFDLEETQGGVIDWDFIREHTSGFEGFKEALDRSDWPTLVERSGVSEAQIREVAEVYARSQASIACWAMGLTQHVNGVDNIQEVVNLLLLKGNLGKPGAGACPVRGHSNVQGDRTVGIIERPTEALCQALEARFGFSVPREHGYDVAHAIEAMHRGDAELFFGMGGNFVSATPDTDLTAEALQRCSLSVQVSTKLNRSHLITGREALILPCLGRTERDERGLGAQFVTVEDSMSVVHRSQGTRPPASGELISEVAIVCGLADQLWGSEALNWAGYAEDYSLIRAEIEACIPGFDSYERRSERGFVLPNGARERRWKVDGARARFTVLEVPEHTLKEGQLMMMTVRSHDQYNTTIYGWDDRYRGVYGARRVVMMCPEDMASRGLREGSEVELKSYFEGEERVASGFRVIPQSIPQGCVATYFPEANPLVPVRLRARKSNTPASKSIVVTVEAI